MFMFLCYQTCHLLQAPLPKAGGKKRHLNKWEREAARAEKALTNAEVAVSAEAEAPEVQAPIKRPRMMGVLAARDVSLCLVKRRVGRYE